MLRLRPGWMHVEPIGEPDPRERPAAQDEAGAGSSSSRASGPLHEALRRARVENAERAEALCEVRDAEAARLELLRDRLAPIFDELPDDCDAFDFALSHGAKPRLFLDMIAFVEMARDGKTYTLLQDTRRGRARLAASARMDDMTRAVADYVARRLVERERMLAGDIYAPASHEIGSVARVEAPALSAPGPAPAAEPEQARLPRADAFTYAIVDSRTRDAEVAARARRVGETTRQAAAQPARPRGLRIAWRAMRVLMEMLGALAVLGGAVLAVAWLVRHYGL